MIDRTFPEQLTTPARPDSTRESSATSLPSNSKRLISLDAFRGLTVLLMLLVNNAAMDEATPQQFMHAPWNQGIRLADVVFPWFLFAVGIAVPFSFRGAIRRGQTGRQFYTRVVLRTVALLVIGCIVDSAIDKQLYIGLGVLQLIGLAYWAGAVLYALSPTRRAVVAGVMLVGYGLAIQFVPVPGFGEPVFLEGKNLIHFINMEYLLAFKLKGLLSVIPTGALVAIGTFVGDRALNRSQSRSAATSFPMLLLLVGGALTALGFLWNLWLPFNKPVWTPSYILACAGLGSILISILSLLLDGGRLRWLGFPLVVFGANALLAYVAPILVKVLVLQEIELERSATTVNLQDWLQLSLKDPLGQAFGGWIYTVSYILVVWVALAFLYKKRWFLKV